MVQPISQLTGLGAVPFVLQSVVCHHNVNHLADREAEGTTPVGVLGADNRICPRKEVPVLVEQ